MFRAITEWWKGPWRNPSKEKWNKKLSNDLKEEVKNIKFASGVRKAGLLFCGPSTSGVSSLINTIFSIGAGRPVFVSAAMGSTTRVTLQYLRQTEDCYFKNFEVRDTFGLAEGQWRGFNIQDFKYALNGNIKANYKFKEEEAIQTTSDYFEMSPYEEDKTHCLVIVLDVLYLDKFTDKFCYKFMQIVREATAKGIPMVLILTKIDILDTNVKKDITHLFHSRKVEDTVRMAESLLGFQTKNIHPVVNFVDDTEVDPVKSIPVLLALRQILYYASERIEQSHA